MNKLSEHNIPLSFYLCYEGEITVQIILLYKAIKFLVPLITVIHAFIEQDQIAIDQ